MENFSIDARQVRAAMIMKAKNDIRCYLNGILIGGGKVVATDGHRLIVVNSPSSTFEPSIFTIKGKIPKKAIDCEFVFIGDDHGVITSKDRMSNEIDAVVKFSVVSGNYPDYKKVMPNGEPDNISSIGFNIGYLADIHKASKELGSVSDCGEFNFYGKSVTVNIKTTENKATCVVMAMRL